MFKEQDKLRTGPKIYHDLVFEEEIKNLINITKGHYDACVPLVFLDIKTPNIPHI